MKIFYHGHGQRGPYFEGWYLKLQPPQGRGLALIPAVHIDSTGRASASLQVITDGAAWYLDYPGKTFQAARRRFQVSLDKNVFNAKGMRLEVDKGGLSLHGTVHFGPLTPLKSDIMGPFRFLPGMECAHGVLSMGHKLDGSLYLNGQQLDFSGGVGYMETDRGRSFPSAYLWTQCVWGPPPHLSSLMLSIATIPMGAAGFTGCICAVCCNGREYRLATYRGARVEGWGEHGGVIRQGKYRLAVEVLSAQGQPLRAPVHGSMGRTIRESLCATLRLRFWEGSKLIFDHTDHRCSFEYAAQNGNKKSR